MIQSGTKPVGKSRITILEVLIYDVYLFRNPRVPSVSDAKLITLDTTYYFYKLIIFVFVRVYISTLAMQTDLFSYVVRIRFWRAW